MKRFQDSQIPYELRKTIRFALQPKNISRAYTPPKSNDEDLHRRVADFIGKYSFVIENLDKIVFSNSENDEEKKLQKKVYIKHTWLKNYTKTEFYNAKEEIVIYDRKKNNQISIGDRNVDFLRDYFKNWLNENRGCVENLKRFLNQPEEKQKRISEYAYWIQKILKRSNFKAVFELFHDNIQHKDSDEEILSIKEKLLEVKSLLELLEKELLPSQSLGVEIEQSSFNYYTVNKKPKNYNSEIKDAEQKENKKLLDFKEYNKKNNKKKNAFSFKSLDFLKAAIENLDDDNFVEEQCGKITEIKKDFNHLKIKSAYKFLKDYKANEKSKFFELLSKGKTDVEIGRECPLFACSDGNFLKIKNLTDQINKASDEKKRKPLKEARGKHFDVVRENGRLCSFKNYKKICSLFQEIAMEIGKIKAEAKALKKEKIDAERLQSWSIILEKDNQRYILTIPRDAQNNLQNAKKYIDSLQGEKSGEWKLHSFESLALRALDKLCFGFDKNTFYPRIESALKLKGKSFFIKDRLKRKDEFSKDGSELVKFYQTVLGLRATGEMLALANFEGLSEIIKTDYANKEDFEKDLKRACYFKKSVTISESIKDEIIKNYQGNLYKITSYDLEKDDDEEIANLKNKQKLDRRSPEAHTKIWLNFWTNKNIENKYEIRLNPEFKINFVENSFKELENRNLGELKKNRRQQDRFLLSTTITLQAHDKSADLNFKGTDEIIKFIEGYNKEFNKKIKPFDIYYYGLDRGQKELLTLGLFKFSETEKVKFAKQDGAHGEYNKPEFINIETYQIKPDKYLEKNDKGRIAYKSASEFMDNFDVVEKISTSSCFDMSCAKLIKDKIVINGDIATYLEMKRVSALRKIYEGMTQGRFRSDTICFNAEKGALFLNIENRGKLENENLYFYNERFKDILSLEAIKKELQGYYNLLKSKKAVEVITVNKINHLRDALCANAVGILSYLQKQYFGMMFLENLELSNKNKRIEEFSGNLASRIEWRILQKFQTLLLVPPVYKQVMVLQDKKFINQLGIVAYIESRGTTKECPHCSTKNGDNSEKWSNHAYKCRNTMCNFDTSDQGKRRGLISLDNSDSLAAYNIAKRGLSLISEKLQSPPTDSNTPA